MTRDDVYERVSAHLADELQIDPGRISRSARFKEDLGADSLHLVELVMELEDSYGVRIPAADARGIKTVGEAVEYVVNALAAA